MNGEETVEKGKGASKSTMTTPMQSVPSQRRSQANNGDSKRKGSEISLDANASQQQLTTTCIDNETAAADLLQPPPKKKCMGLLSLVTHELSKPGKEDSGSAEEDTHTQIPVMAGEISPVKTGTKSKFIFMENETEVHTQPSAEERIIIQTQKDTSVKEIEGEGEGKSSDSTTDLAKQEAREDFFENEVEGNRQMDTEVKSCSSRKRGTSIVKPLPIYNAVKADGTENTPVEANEKAEKSDDILEMKENDNDSEKISAKVTAEEKSPVKAKSSEKSAVIICDQQQTIKDGKSDDSTSSIHADPAGSATRNTPDLPAPQATCETRSEPDQMQVDLSTSPPIDEKISKEGIAGDKSHDAPKTKIEENAASLTTTEEILSNTKNKNNNGLTNNQAMPEKHTRSKHMDPKVLEIRRRIQLGCRDNDLASALDVYEEAVSQNIKLEAQSFYNLLNLCDGLDRTVHIGTPKVSTNNNEVDENKDVSRIINSRTRQSYIFILRDHMKQLNYPLNETAYSAIVKLLSKNGEFQMASKTLMEAEQVQQCKPKLRLYSSLLTAYCEAGLMVKALGVWKALTRRNLQITEKEYVALIKCATTTGDSLVLQRVLTDLAEEVLVPSKETVAALLEWFELAHSFHTEILTKQHADEAEVKTLLEDIHQGEKEAPPDMGPVVNVKGWEISSACPVDTTTGLIKSGCFKGLKLKPVPISIRAWNEMKCMNAQIVVEGEVDGSSSKFQGGKKGEKRMSFCPIKRKKEWERFADFLTSVGQLDVVLDGANIGMYETNFIGAPRHVDYKQIDWVVQHFTKRNKKVLLVLHERHFSRDLMPDKYRPLQERWETEKILYKTPRGMNDDWFWLHAAYTYKSLVVTNDEMRDHHFQMLAPRTFLRWKQRHHIHFNFGDWNKADGGGNVREREVILSYPESYSRRVQRVEDGIVVPLAKRGDKNRFMDGGHIACDDEPEEETYVSIRPAARQAKDPCVR